MGLEAKSKQDLLKAITENWWWVLVNTKIIDARYLEENFTQDELNAAGIYTYGDFETSTAAFACGSATVKACGSATVKACDNSYVEDCTGNIRPSGDYAIVKDYYNHRAYIKKGKFEIIEIE